MEQSIKEISRRLDELSVKFDKLVEINQHHLNKPYQIEGWLIEGEAQKLLGLKSTSMWSLRKQRLIRFSKIGGKTYYNLESIKKLLEKNQE